MIILDLPRKYNISYSETIPRRVMKEPVLTTTIVDKDHNNNADSENK